MQVNCRVVHTCWHTISGVPVRSNSCSQVYVAVLPYDVDVKSTLAPFIGGGGDPQSDSVTRSNLICLIICVSVMAYCRYVNNIAQIDT